MRTLVLIVVLATVAQAEKHYIDSNAPKAADSGLRTRSMPWKSLAAVAGHEFRPGDVVYFARGSNYQGGVVVKDSGAAGRPRASATPATRPSPATSSKCGAAS